MVLTGATAAFTPKHVLAAALAGKASDHLSPRVSGLHPLGGLLEVEEFRVHERSELVGRTLAESDIRRRTGATVIGLWNHGGFRDLPPPNTRIDPGCILLTVGAGAALQRLRDLAQVRRRTGPIVVIGYGIVGERTVDMLRDANEVVRVLDRSAREGVDVVGDALDPDVLTEAGVGEAKAVVLAIDSGSPSLLAAALIRDLAPDVPIVARVERSRDITRIHQAGADFAMSVGQVASQLLMPLLLGGSEMVLEAHLRFISATPRDIEGRRVHETQIQSRTGRAVVAVARGDEVLVQLGGQFRFERDDTLYVCGPEEAIVRFREMFPDRERTVMPVV